MKHTSTKIAAAVLIGVASALRAQDAPPNLLLVVTDDQRFDQM